MPDLTWRKLELIDECYEAWLAGRTDGLSRGLPRAGCVRTSETPSGGKSGTITRFCG